MMANNYRKKAVEIMDCLLQVYMSNMQSELMRGMSEIFEKMASTDRRIEIVATKDDLANLTAELTVVKSKVNVLEEENLSFKKNLETITKEHEIDRRKLHALEEQFEKKSLIFKNIPPRCSIKNAVKSICEKKLKLKKQPEVTTTTWIVENEMNVTMAEEFDNDEIVDEFLLHTKNLGGTSISISRDLNTDEQQQKKATLQLQKRLMSVKSNQQVLVRDHKLRVEGKWLIWNWDKRLVNGKADDMIELKKIYGNIDSVFVNYSRLIVDATSNN